MLRRLVFSCRTERSGSQKPFRFPLTSPRLAAKDIELFGATQAGQVAPKSFEDLLKVLPVEIESVDNDGRMAITRLAKTYQENPAEGAKIAKVILALVGES